MNVRWTERALRDLQSLHAYISQDNEPAAADTVERILDGLDALERNPAMGRKGRVEGTRELVIAPFVVAYRIRHAAVEIIAIIHGARRWPDSFD